MSMDLKNNVLGSLRTAWQSFSRLPVAALPPVEAGETTIERDLQEPQSRKNFFFFLPLCIWGCFLYVCVNMSESMHKSVSNPFSPYSFHPSLHVATLSLRLFCFIWWLFLLPSPLTTLSWTSASAAVTASAKREEKSADFWTKILEWPRALYKHYFKGKPG